MANQAIALQSRAPQGNFLGPALREGAQMVNMMRQQEAADLQAAATNEQLRIARAKEEREATAAQEERAHNATIRPYEVSAAKAAELKAQLGNNLDFITLANIRIKNARNREAVIGAADELRRLYPTQSQYIDQALAGMPTDPAAFEAWREESVFLSQDAKDQAAKTQVVQGKNGKYYVLTYGIPGKNPAAIEAERYDLGNPNTSPTNVAPANPMAAPTPANAMATPANPMAAPAPAPAPAPNPMAAPMPGPNTNPVGGAPLNIQSGNMYEPTSMRAGPQMRGAQPKLADIIKEATASRKISESNLQMIRNVAGPDKDAQLIQLLKAENIDIVPDESPFRSAAMRSDEAPQFQQTQSRGSYIRSNEGLEGKPPMQGPYPGSALVPPSVLAAQAGAEARARGQVEKSLRKTPAEIETEAEATARGTAKAKRPKESAKAYTAMVNAVARYDEVIDRAKSLLDSPGLDAIVGNIQGSLPEFAVALQSQAAADALADYEALIAPAGFQELQQLRDASETGGALGNQSDKENVLTQNSAFTASRRQSLPKMKGSLREFITRMDASKQRLKDAYVREYGRAFSVRPGAIGPLAGISPLRRSGGPEYNPRTQAPKPQGQPARPRTEAEFNRIPVGAQYIDPDDGKVYTKVR